MCVCLKYMHTIIKTKIFATFYFSRHDRMAQKRNEICCSRFLLPLLCSLKVAHTCRIIIYSIYVCMT